MRKFTGVVLALTLCLGLAACGAEDSRQRRQIHRLYRRQQEYQIRQERTKLTK